MVASIVPHWLAWHLLAATLGLRILPPLIVSFFLFHAEMMVFLYYYTPFTAQNVALIGFGDTDKNLSPTGSSGSS